jgi:hypothetical protein
VVHKEKGEKEINKRWKEGADRILFFCREKNLMKIKLM